MTAPGILDGLSSLLGCKKPEKTVNLFRFSLGPVSGFIGEARRTRDWWAGSFLLSLLTASAIRAANRAKAEILSPFRLPPNASETQITACDDPFYIAFTGGTAQEYEATLPNQFRAIVPDGFDPKVCRDAVLERWRALAGAVWEEFVGPHVPEAKAIWDEQIGTGDVSFWETIWVMGAATPSEVENRIDDDWLALRKRNRAPFYLGDIGPGDLCSLMPDFREISGFSRSADRVKQEAFWKKLADGIEMRANSENLDLRAGERLSAPALVKRLFPRLPKCELGKNKRGREGLIGWVPPSAETWEARLHDHWGVGCPEKSINLRFWPSTAAIAAHGWVRKVVNASAPSHDIIRTFVEGFESKEFKNIRSRHRLTRAERQNRMYEPLVYPNGRQSVEKLVREFCALDGKLFFANEYDNDDLAVGFGLAAPGQVKDEHRKLLAPAKAALMAITGTDGIGRPCPWFAVVQVDGDEIGKLLGAAPDSLPGKLRTFNRELWLQFGSADGPFADILYASADEAMIVCPADQALKVAETVHSLWNDQEIETSLSASVIFARYNMALGWVMRRSGQALHDFAKEKNGRDSLSVEVMRSSGPHRRWLTQWQKGDVGALQAFNAVYDRRAAGKRLFASNRFVHDFEALIAQLSGRLPGRDEPLHYPGGRAAEDALALALKLAAAKEERSELRSDRDLPKYLDALIAPSCEDDTNATNGNAFHIMRFLADCEKGDSA